MGAEELTTVLPATVIAWPLLDKSMNVSFAQVSSDVPLTAGNVDVPASNVLYELRTLTTFQSPASSAV